MRGLRPEFQHQWRIVCLGRLYGERIDQLQQSALRVGGYLWSQVDAYRFGNSTDPPPGAKPGIAWVHEGYPSIDAADSADKTAIAARIAAAMRHW
jgi:hypothetical protein